MKTHDKIRAIRLLKNYSQEYLAIEIGIDTSSYCRIEKGATTLSIQRLEKIAQILGVSVAEIFFFGEKETDRGFKENNHKHLEEEISFLRDQLLEKNKQIHELIFSGLLNQHGRTMSHNY